MSTETTRKQKRLTSFWIVIGKEYPEVFNDRDTAGGKFTICVPLSNVDATGELLEKFYFLIVVTPGNNINSAFIF